MPRGKWIDKKTATHYTLVHRPQNDPLIHDESAPPMVLKPRNLPNVSKSKRLDDLAFELGSDAQSIRDNEGEAASYGIYYDDTKYDYMQHMRDLDDGTHGAVFVEAVPVINKSQGKQKGSLEDVLREPDLPNKTGGLFDEQMLPSKNLQRLNYQSQQDVPDAIAGFQPNMDPRLREALEALEDEAYVDDDDDIFQELAKDAKEVSTHEFEDMHGEFEDEEGWESDATAKPAKNYKREEIPQTAGEAPERPTEGPSQDWLEDFNQFKKDQKTERKLGAVAAVAPSDMQSSAWTATTNGGSKKKKKKKRKGALTNPSVYSMSSSSMVRTDQMRILDARFEKIEEEYNADMNDNMSSMSSISGLSTVTSMRTPMPAEFDSMMDEFLDSYSFRGKRGIKKGKPLSGPDEFDELRRELGPARINPGFQG